MSTELTYLTWITALTALMWIPYILNMIAVRGLMNAVGYPQDPEPLSAWATRMKAAHANSIENLAVFGLLVLVAHLAGINNGVTEAACIVYFWARVIHFLSYTGRIPWVRTLSFLAGFGAQMAIALQILL